MAVVQYVPNPAFEQGVRKQAVHKKGMHSITKRTLRAVKAAARPSRNTGYYERSLKVWGQSIVSTDPFWHLSEFGSVNNVPSAAFRRGLRAAGVRLVMDPKPPR